jgi:hypothetical protein
MPLVGFEPTVSAGGHVLDCAATGTGLYQVTPTSFYDIYTIQ